ncbi:iron transporter [Streptomyces nigrescens]|uniref:Iron transporter n=2 Tax=Streptomyces TaxID=1883 RepID=A0ABN6QZ94_STRNI|nr:EfeM/EfeO family lipoprotein [Streptomyces nigrescens]MEE4422173.1 EfeM/EfeO family lipoprotein [Streptomyces sp. DSM 41528]BDM70767.1 iron transporter [Streptomyces nigrescens]
MRSTTRTGAVGGVLVAGGLLAGLLLTGGADDAEAGRAAPDGLPHTGIEVSPSRCGRGWQHPHPGLQVFDLHNTSDTAAEVYLKNPADGSVYGEVEGIGPGTTRQLRIRLGRGAYAFMCLPDDTHAVTGPTARVTGGGPAGPAAAPVTEHDLIPPALAYQKWVGRGLDGLVGETGRLRDALADGDRAAAEDAWLSAHLAYERLGAAYGAFGDADGKINGTTAGLPDGVRDPAFTGFHRIEYGLWHGRTTASLRGPATALAAAVKALRDDWAEARMEPADLGLRAHEILENTLQFELTGRTDYGSGSNLATARANLDGTRAVLARLRPLLVTRYPELPALERKLDRAQDLLDGFRRDGRWTPLDRLDRRQRERADAVLGDLVERLASVATLCDARRTV